MRMKFFTNIMPLAMAVAVAAACERKELEIWTGGGRSVSLRAEVMQVRKSTRGEGAFTGQTPGEDNPLVAAVWFTSREGSYPGHLPQGWDKAVYEETGTPMHGTISYTGAGATFPDREEGKREVRYPGGEGEIYCTGMYPATGWSVEGADWSTASHTITGKEDLMLSPEIAGSWRVRFPRQCYRHLLTWIKICAVATTPSAGEYWGEVQEITLCGTPSKVSVDLKGKEGEEWKVKDFASYEGMADLPLLGDGDLLDFPAGLQYVVTLYFHPYNVVEGVCTLNAWNAQEEDLYPQK